MTNHAFASSQGRLTDEKLREALDEIVQRRFGSHFRINDNNQVIPTHDEFNDGYLCVSVWLGSKRKIALRKGTGDISSWVQCVLQEELAHKFGGRCSDEGVSEIWKPEIRFHTFKEYYFHIHSWSKDPAVVTVVHKIYESYVNKYKRFGES